MVAARDVEVKALTEKLKAFASETRRLIEQLKAETVPQSLSLLVLHARWSCCSFQTMNLSGWTIMFCTYQAKSKELAEHYSALQGDLDAAEAKLDEMAQLNRTLVRVWRGQAFCQARQVAPL